MAAQILADTPLEVGILRENHSVTSLLKPYSMEIAKLTTAETCANVTNFMGNNSLVLSQVT